MYDPETAASEAIKRAEEELRFALAQLDRRELRQGRRYEATIEGLRDVLALLGPIRRNQP